MSAEVVYNLSLLAFDKSEVYDINTIRDYCNRGHCYLDGKYRGYILFDERKSDLNPAVMVPTITHLGVHPNHRRQGVAQLLINTVLQRYQGRSVYLHVRSKNLAAQALYLKLKFTAVAMLPGYYNSTAVPDDGYYMVYVPLASLNCAP